MALSTSQNLKVLDFGGGVGVQYLEMISKAPHSIENANYYIVDGKSTIDNRPRELDQFKNLHFYSDLTDIKEKMDIVHIGSTLQYIEDWQSLLIKINETYSPKYYVFSDLLAGDIPTFVSRQIFWEKRIPVKMFNLTEFEHLFKLMKFGLLYKSMFHVSILNSANLPNVSLPENHRLRHTLNMVFMKNETK